MKILLTHLAAVPAGRIALHILCALRSHHWLWHGRGIVRELSCAKTSGEFSREESPLFRGQWPNGPQPG